MSSAVSIAVPAAPLMVLCDRSVSCMDLSSIPFRTLPTVTLIPGTVPANLSSLGCGLSNSLRTMMGLWGAVGSLSF